MDKIKQRAPIGVTLVSDTGICAIGSRPARLSHIDVLLESGECSEQI